MHYQLLNILRRFISGKAGKWLATLIILLPLIFIVSRFMGLSRNISLMMMGGAVGLILIIWLIDSFRNAKKRSKASQNFENDLGRHSTGAAASQEEIQQAVDDVSMKWGDALRELKEHRVPIYDMPWFLLIGEPQSGKTTTLEKSGLEFPIGQEAISGAGGTRNCDWWFTEEAVILDTAGRFTFQEEMAPDKHEWEAFLRLLKQHRKECPINGVLVVIPATSLTEDTVDQQLEKAKNIRRKLENLQKALEIRFPIFVLITKSDRILGFSEFFGTLHPDLHGQIFGWSNPEEDKRWDPGDLPGIVGEITARMHKLRIRLMQEAQDSQAVDRFFVFPEELTELEKPLLTYFETIFKASSRFQEPFIFRGFYLTSGLQEGRPIAVACRELLKVQVGDHRQVLEELETVLTHKFAFFIRDFYSKKVFPEQGLVKRTIEAMEKEKKLQRTSKILVGVAIVAIILGLLPAIGKLSQVLKPVNEVAADAKLCIEAAGSTEPCGVDYTYELIHKIETTRERLGDSRWLMRLLLQGGTKNEISQELLPTLQAGLFRLGVLGQLLESFEARSGPEIWQQEELDYEGFRQAYMERLRFDEYQRTESRKDDLKEAVTLEPILRFLEKHPGADPSQNGLEIDRWLADTSTLGDIAEIEKIFQSVLHTEERFDLMAVGRLPQPEKAQAAFDAYWTVEVLASRQYELITSYLEGFETQYREILSLDPEGEGAEGTLTRFAMASGELDRIYTEGASFMVHETEESPADAEEMEEAEGEEAEDDGEDTTTAQRRGPRRAPPRPDPEAIRQALDVERPGANVEAWERNCGTDYKALRDIYDRVISQQDVTQRCTVEIPEDWRRLLAQRSEFDYLYTEAPDGTLEWSEGASTLRAPFATLSSVLTPDIVASEREAFQGRMDGALGDDGKLREIKEFYRLRRESLDPPVDAMRKFRDSRPDDRFQAARGHEAAELVAALGIGTALLPPTSEYLSDKFDLGCNACFRKTYAESFVVPANELLGLYNAALRPVTAVRDIREPLDTINTALYQYLEAYIERQTATSGGGIARPYSAAQADSWPQFADAIRAWQLTSARTGGGASGLTESMVQDFANANDRLTPLVEFFRESSRPKAAVKVPANLRRAVDEYKATIDLLDDDPLKAWLQLAREEDGTSLDDFHTFSRNGTLRRSNLTKWLIPNIEEHGAKLLSDAIRPKFERDAERLWDTIDDCCRGRFPFIREQELVEQRRSYEQGFGNDGLWLDRENDQRNEIATLKLDLPTASRDDIDRLFSSRGDYADLFEDYALAAILDTDRDGNRLTSVDFVSPQRGAFQALRQWQVFLYGRDQDDRDYRRGGLPDDMTFDLRILEDEQTADRIYLGKRVGRISLFSRDAMIRPSTDARTGRRLDIPLRFDEAPLYITGTNEDAGSGWNGRLELRGGPLKLLYFVLLSREEVRPDRQVWTVRIEIPDFAQPRNRLEGLFELTFDDPVPGVVDGGR